MTLSAKVKLPLNVSRTIAGELFDSGGDIRSAISESTLINICEILCFYFEMNQQEEDAYVAIRDTLNKETMIKHSLDALYRIRDVMEAPINAWKQEHAKRREMAWELRLDPDRAAAFSGIIATSPVGPNPPIVQISRELIESIERTSLEIKEKLFDLSASKEKLLLSKYVLRIVTLENIQRERR